MELNNSDLKNWLSETSELFENAFFNNVQQLTRNTFKMKLLTKKGSKDLIVRLPEGCFFTDYKLAAPTQASNLAMFLRKRLKGLKITKVTQHDADRVFYLEIGKESTEYFLVIELFGKGNIILCDKDWKIEYVLDSHTWKDRDLRRRQDYEFPKASIEWREPQFKDNANEEIQKTLMPDLEKEFTSADKKDKKLSTLKHRLKTQEKSLEKFEKQAEKFKEFGDKLYEHYGVIEQVITELKAARKKHSWKEIQEMLKESNSKLSRIITKIEPKKGLVTVKID